MSRAKWPFPALAIDAVEQINAVAQCRQAGIDPCWQDAPEQGAAVRFEVKTPALWMMVRVPAEAWWTWHWPSLASLAWTELTTPRVLQRLMPSEPLLHFEHPVLQGAQVSMQGLVAAGAASAATPLPTLATAQGEACIERARCLLPAPLVRAAASVPLQLELQIARLEMPIRQLRNLAAGSIVLIEHLAPIARVQGMPACIFEFTFETFTVNQTLDFLEENKDGLEPMPGEIPVATGTDEDAPRSLDVSRLPVSVDVVLCRLPWTVKELSNLRPGAVFALPEDCWRQLQLRINGQSIGGGELVQIGEQLGMRLSTAPDVS